MPRIKRADVPPPLVMVLPVTYRCNLKCVMCGIWDNPQTKELSLEKIRELFSDPLVAGHIRKLNITGGEPSLRDDIADIFRATNRLRAVDEIGISTNGSTGPRFKRMVEAAMETISPKVKLTFSLSIDGIGAAHDRVRGVPRSFERLVKTLAWLKETAKARPGTVVAMNSTIGAFNLDQAEAVLDFAEKESVGVGFSPASENDVFINSLRRSRDFSAAGHAAELAGAFRALYRRTGYPYYRMIVRQIETGPFMNPCLARERGALVDVDGSVYPCGQSAKHKLGDLHKNSFSEIWNSAQAAEARKDIRKVCVGCMTNCYADVVAAEERAWKRPAAKKGLSGKDIERLVEDARNEGKEPEPFSWTFEKVAFYGAGTNALRLLKRRPFSSGRCRVVAVADDRRELWGTKIGGVPIIPPEKLRRREIDAIIVTPSFGTRAMARRLAGIESLSDVPVFGVPRAWLDPYGFQDGEDEEK